MSDAIIDPETETVQMFVRPEDGDESARAESSPLLGVEAVELAASLDW